VTPNDRDECQYPLLSFFPPPSCFFNTKTFACAARLPVSCGVSLFVVSLLGEYPQSLFLFFFRFLRVDFVFASHVENPVIVCVVLCSNQSTSTDHNAKIKHALEAR
jgi:hypothetical protein